jgi:hypothetical protein
LVPRAETVLPDLILCNVFTYRSAISSPHID